jgi:hypothetical protein
MNTEAQGMTEPTPEPQPACPVCKHPRHNWSVCPDCVARVDAALAGILDLHVMAATCLEPGTTSDGGPIGLHRDPPIPVDLGALDLSHGEGVLGVLEQWERWWRETWGLAPYGEASASRLIGPYSHGTAEPASTATSRNLSGTVRFLRARWPIAAQVVEPPPEEFADEVLRLHRECLAALHRIPSDLDLSIDPPPDYVVSCPSDDCGHRIPMTRQYRSVDGEKASEVNVNCPRCGSHWTSTRLLLVASVSGARVEISVEDAMAHYGCSRATVYRMVNRGELRRGRYGRVVLGGRTEVAG